MACSAGWPLTLLMIDLQIQPALEFLQGIAQRLGELGEGFELEIIRVGMRPAQKRQTPVRQLHRNRNVGGQHELLDDLMALIVFGFVGSGDVRPSGLKSILTSGRCSSNAPASNRRLRSIIARVVHVRPEAAELSH